MITALLVVLAIVGWLTPRTLGLGAATSTSPGPAPGQRAASDSAPLRLVGFGDSVLAGAGCDCDDYLVQAAEQVHHDTGRRVTTSNGGVNGATAADLLDELHTDEKAIAQVKRADVIVLTVGANDLQPSLDSWADRGCNADCYQPGITSMAARLDTVLTVIDQSKKPGTTVLVTDYWNVYLDGEVGRRTYGAGYLSWSDTVTKAANKAICQAAEQGHATCVDLYRPFKGDGGDDPTELLAGDGDHANARGTEAISRTVADAIERALTVDPTDAH